MLLQRLTQYLLRHRYQTLAFTFFVTFLPVVGVLGILIAAFITLVQGVKEGLLFTLAAINAVVPFIFWVGLIISVLSVLLVWFFAAMLRQQTSWSSILQMTALLGALVVSVIHLFYPEVSSFWAKSIGNYFTEVFSSTAQTSETQGVLTQVLEATESTKQYLLGVTTSAVLMGVISQLMVACWWQAVLYHPGSLQRGLHSIRLSPMAGILFAMSLVFAYLGNSVISDIIPIICVLFGAAGLSLIHYFLGNMKVKSRWMWLFFLYVVLIYTCPISVMLLAMLAWADVWFDLRKRFSKA